MDLKVPNIGVIEVTPSQLITPEDQDALHRAKMANLILDYCKQIAKDNTRGGLLRALDILDHGLLGSIKKSEDRTIKYVKNYLIANNGDTSFDILTSIVFEYIDLDMEDVRIARYGKNGWIFDKLS
ncbi:MAG: hypothetical protein ACD_84C00004G0004 [uncultured bacterium]|nr:MAG: hypothetical protein ACD_84C00004G0004 [uncultured bacterium]